MGLTVSLLTLTRLSRIRVANYLYAFPFMGPYIKRHRRIINKRLLRRRLRIKWFPPIDAFTTYFPRYRVCPVINKKARKIKYKNKEILTTEYNLERFTRFSRNGINMRYFDPIRDHTLSLVPNTNALWYKKTRYMLNN